MPQDDTLKPVYLNTVPCHGCGACAEIAPEVFRMDELTSLPELLVSEATAEVIRQAMAYCPNDCISTDDE